MVNASDTVVYSASILASSAFFQIARARSLLKRQCTCRQMLRV